MQYKYKKSTTAQILAQEIVEQLEAALLKFRSVEEVLNGNGETPA